MASITPPTDGDNNDSSSDSRNATSSRPEHAEPQTGRNHKPEEASSSRPSLPKSTHGSGVGQYEPSVVDVLIVKAMLAMATALPPELVDRIVDSAEYWPHTTTEVNYMADPLDPNPDPASLEVHASTGGITHVALLRGRISQGLVVRGGRGPENRFLLRTPPLGFPASPYPTRAALLAALDPPLPVTAEHPVAAFQALIGSPVPPVTHPCRKIVFTITSHDQGWGGQPEHRGTFQSSWTWFEAGLERCRKDDGTATDQNKSKSKSKSKSGKQDESDTARAPCFDPAAGGLGSVHPAVVCDSDGTHRYDLPLLADDAFKVQANRHADAAATTHRVVWARTDDIRPGDMAAMYELEEKGRGRATGDGEFVRRLKLGDVVTLWAKARFPGWSNMVERVKVDVYWSV